ncbi:glycolate oxidase [Quadrisphaera granulorum]|uniref:Glycolate oxidase n=1 Tax=Quadrisphaera granulorum TaxID=317664 RepID=A0A316A825_9ACTN|nr:FAD-linked oxidase C-terminal domain-containing protein [Quadrisphaera granulorum]PWJ53865.1 glycolate oxidase [Quadrisphaera granulorum]SZE96622.1 glycolate oxidase [Quadrisphaera granulorum]
MSALSSTAQRSDPVPPHLAELVGELVGELGPRVLLDPAQLAEHSRDASRAQPVGAALAVVAATCTDDVSAALRWASRHRVKVSVRGAGSGLAGGAVAYPDGLVISTAAMRRIVHLDPEAMLVDVEAGVVTADVDAAAAEHGLMYAPDPASHRWSTIGGNIATNAGGLRCVRHGVTADHVAALEVVLASGDVIRTGARTRKDVVGYDLTRLFVGSEGTLGVVTGATLRLRPRPTGPERTFRAVFGSLVDAGRAVTALAASGARPEVLELMDRASALAVEAHHPTGLDLRDSAAVLVGQFLGRNAEQDARTAESVCRAHGVQRVEVAQSDDLLEARRVAGRVLSAAGLRVSCDVGVPVPRLAEMFTAIAQISAEEGVLMPTFAHAGDGNLHPSVIVDGDDDAGRAHAEHVLDRVADAALALGGTISGEHGVGSLKRHALPRQLDDATHAAHRLVKDAFDPLGILTPQRAV